MDHADHMSRTIALAVAMIEGTRPEQYAAPSPCADFTAADVVNHLAFGLLLAHRSATREPWDPTWTGESRAPFLDGLAESEWAPACARQASATAAAWADPSVWDGETHMAGSPMPAAVVGSIMTAEFAVHAWDLAVATGQRVDVPDALGEVVLAGLLPIAQMGREGGWFAPEVPVPADATPFTRALATSGRDPRWTRS